MNAARGGVDRLFVVVVGLLSAYMAVTTFVFVQLTPHHNATLVGGIVGQVLANLTGQVEKSGGGRGPGVGRR